MSGQEFKEGSSPPVLPEDAPKPVFAFCCFCGATSDETEGNAVAYVHDHVKVCPRHPIRDVERERDFLKSDLQAAHDMLTDSSIFRDLLREAMGVPVEPHQTQNDRMLEAAKGISDSPTWIKFDSMDHATDPKDGETVLGWWAPVAATGYRGGMESVTFGAADEDGRSDTWTNAFGDSTDPPDYWTRLRGPK